MHTGPRPSQSEPLLGRAVPLHSPWGTSWDKVSPELFAALGSAWKKQGSKTEREWLCLRPALPQSSRITWTNHVCYTKKFLFSPEANWLGYLSPEIKIFLLKYWVQVTLFKKRTWTLRACLFWYSNQGQCHLETLYQEWPSLVWKSQSFLTSAVASKGWGDSFAWTFPRMGLSPSHKADYLIARHLWFLEIKPNLAPWHFSSSLFHSLKIHRILACAPTHTPNPSKSSDV